jgi:hypothetical protein
MKKDKRKLTFYQRIIQLKISPNYPLEEYLDDCRRVRARNSGTALCDGDSTDVAAWLDSNELELVESYLDEFEAWLKLQI